MNGLGLGVGGRPGRRADARPAHGLGHAGQGVADVFPEPPRGPLRIAGPPRAGRLRSRHHDESTGAGRRVAGGRDRAGPGRAARRGRGAGHPGLGRGGDRGDRPGPRRDRLRHGRDHRAGSCRGRPGGGLVAGRARLADPDGAADRGSSDAFESVVYRLAGRSAASRRRPASVEVEILSTDMPVAETEADLADLPESTRLMLERVVELFAPRRLRGHDAPVGDRVATPPRRRRTPPSGSSSPPVAAASPHSASIATTSSASSTSRTCSPTWTTWARIATTA